MAQAPALPHGFELALEPRLPRIGSVDQVAGEERGVWLSRRSIERESKRLAAENVKRIAGSGDGQSLWHAAEFLELKTVWHPIGV